MATGIAGIGILGAIGACVGGNGTVPPGSGLNGGSVGALVGTTPGPSVGGGTGKGSGLSSIPDTKNSMTSLR